MRSDTLRTPPHTHTPTHQLWVPLLESPWTENIRITEYVMSWVDAPSQRQICLLGDFSWADLNKHLLVLDREGTNDRPNQQFYQSPTMSVLDLFMGTQMRSYLQKHKQFTIQRHVCLHCKSPSSMGNDSQKLYPWSSLQADWMGDSPHPSHLQWIQSCEFQKLPETSKLLTPWVLMSLPPGHNVNIATQQPAMLPSSTEVLRFQHQFEVIW